MKLFLILLVVALLACCCGFKKYVWFISIGYGAAIAAIGVALLILFRHELSIGIVLYCIFLMLYGARLSGYLAFREVKSAAYNRKMKTEIKSGKDVSFPAKIGIWVSSALLYVAEASPIMFRLANHSGEDALLYIGFVISVGGLILESSADYEKSMAKRVNPKRFVDTGLFRLVRCPNYFGEVLIWTGVFVSGLTILSTPLQWLLAILGYLGIVYVMFGGARRLEMRQNRTYGEDPEYQAYVKKTPILIPFIPLYSVEKYKWLVA